ncbi:MAG: aldehyde dehydrogenase family protein [Phycisphaeraceae bacterium]|nr:MAG: aldehyde dehydrogenase family protein [Phycisphaeraceae bacterium]
MTPRLDVNKTYKLYIGGKFPRSESGRTFPVIGPAGQTVHACAASRKDLRDAVEAARAGLTAWSGATPYLRGQILYRIAEMVEGKRRELADAIDAASPARRAPRAKAKTKPPAGDAEVRLAVDRLVHYAGWADKFQQVLGCNNPVAGPYYNFTIPEPTGVVAVLAPDEAPLLALISLLAPVLAGGNTAVALASTRSPLPALIFAEACATGDVPPGVVNILSGDRAELLKIFAAHRDIDAVHAANLHSDHLAALRAGAAENLKRVTARSGVEWSDAPACHDPWWIEPFVEMKTVWHPAGA